jgi:hypothetical protein
VGSTHSATNGAEAITAVGHRVVHEGAEFRTSVLIDDKVKAAIARLSDLAPLHNPTALKAIEAAEAALPMPVKASQWSAGRRCLRGVAGWFSRSFSVPLFLLRRRSEVSAGHDLRG